MFKEIEGYDYLISDDGVVMNSRGNIMKHKIEKEGYHRVGLTKNKKQKFYRIHRLVGEAFIPNPNNYPLIDHINKVKDDNRVENLRWINVSGNNRNRDGYGKYLKGVQKIGNRYNAKIRIDKYDLYLGTFDTEQEAHQAYLNKYNELMNKF